MFSRKKYQNARLSESTLSCCDQAHLFGDCAVHPEQSILSSITGGSGMGRSQHVDIEGQPSGANAILNAGPVILRSPFLGGFPVTVGDCPMTRRA
jgi:hypothetical protein